MISLGKVVPVFCKIWIHQVCKRKRVSALNAETLSNYIKTVLELSQVPKVPPSGGGGGLVIQHQWHHQHQQIFMSFHFGWPDYTGFGGCA
jgi:hypothetical protein